MKSPIEQAAEKAYPYPSNMQYGGIRVIKKAVKKEIDNKRAAYIQGAKDWGMKWIPVTDGLPENRFVPCLVFNGDAPEYNQHVFGADYFKQKEWFSTNHKYMGTITHYMLLPDPPPGQP
jgi:hypothetical protein